jgi:tetratricopeptide (TPR) repeat protein
MKRKATVIFGIAAMVFCAAAAFAQENGGPIAPKLKGLGKHRHPVTTNSKEAQQFFNQGLVLAYGFNHAEAARSFREAARLDPDCAMAYWGVAYVLGPNINAPMNPDHNKDAMEALHKAISLKDKASEKERAYIDALSKRYVDNPPEDRKPLDLAYADAMREVAKNYPDDLDAQILFAEALMDTMPWDYWEANGDPKPATKEVLAALEGVLERDPKHPQALHLYIHAVEKVHPEKAEEVADRLVNLVPGAGHLVHMPGHIFIRLGRYNDTINVNLDAVEADQSYITQCRQQGIYPLAYMPHNEHFISAAATIAGRSELAVKWAKSIDKGAVESGQMCHPSFGILQHFHATPMFTYVRFGMWDEVLNEPKPEQPYPIGVWHYGRGMAFARTGKLAEARSELAELEKVAADPKAKGVTMFDVNNGGAVLGIAIEVLKGEMAAAEKKYDDAIAHLRKALDLENGLLYSEPEDWPNPVRLNLGAVLLEAGKPAEAEQVYRDDLKKYPNNGWSLLGLRQSLEAQGKKEEAKQAEKEFKRAWKKADVKLVASRF